MLSQVSYLCKHSFHSSSDCLFSEKYVKIFKQLKSSVTDGMFPGGRQMPNFPKGQQSSNKEANLMPVPSPQQIQYLNPLEGQELTIQKQPNTSLRDTDIMSPS